MVLLTSSENSRKRKVAQTCGLCEAVWIRWRPRRGHRMSRYKVTSDVNDLRLEALVCSN